MLYEEMRMRKNGNVKISQLVPMDFPVDCRGYVSKTRKNKAKSRLRIVDATWKTTDGTIWKHKDIDKAIQHELEIMDYENMNVGE